MGKITDYLLDSNVLIEYLNGNDKIVSYIDDLTLKGNCIISIITKIELVSFSNLTPNEIKHIISFLKNFQDINLTDRIALKAAEIRRRYKLKLPDAIIAASAVISKATLVSGDEIFKRLKTPKWVNPFNPFSKLK